jgi:hypothetical protein
MWEEQERAIPTLVEAGMAEGLEKRLTQVQMVHAVAVGLQTSELVEQRFLIV